MLDLLGFKNTTVRAAAILTTSYVAGTVLEGCERFNKLILNYSFTLGSLTDAQIKVEVSTDGVTYYQLMSDSITAGVNSVAALVYKLEANGVGATTPLDINTKYVRVSAIGTGTVTGSSLTINAILAKS